MHDHFIKYGDILEAVVIFDKLTRRSKGYGFVCSSSPFLFSLLVSLSHFVFFVSQYSFLMFFLCR